MKSSSSFFREQFRLAFYFILFSLFCPTIQAQSVRIFRSLEIGNLFVYSERRGGGLEVARHFERVERDTVIVGKRYAVVSSFIFGQTPSQRLERSDESAIYIYENGKEERIHSFYLKIGDTAQTKLLNFNYGKVIVTSVENLFNPNTKDSIAIFSSSQFPNTRFLYAKSTGFSSITTSGSPSGTSSISWTGSILNGVVIGDTSLGRWGVVSVETPQAQFSTSLNLLMPNPFTVSTKISYSLGRTAMVSVGVYSTDGLRIATLLPPTTQITGEYSLTWNGVSSVGANVAAGQYFVVLFVDDKQVGSIAVVKQ